MTDIDDWHPIMKEYLLAMLALIAVVTAVSGLAPGGWDVLLPRLFGA